MAKNTDVPVAEFGHEPRKLISEKIAGTPKPN
jgi:hypothetical protein